MVNSWGRSIILLEKGMTMAGTSMSFSKFMLYVVLFTILVAGFTNYQRGRSIAIEIVGAAICGVLLLVQQCKTRSKQAQNDQLASTAWSTPRINRAQSYDRQTDWARETAQIASRQQQTVTIHRVVKLVSAAALLAAIGMSYHVIMRFKHNQPVSSYELKLILACAIISIGMLVALRGARKHH